MPKLRSIANTISEKTAAFLWKVNPLKSEPANLEELRDHMMLKLRNKYKKGYFVFSMTAKDKQPILMISSDSHDKDGLHADYFKLAFGKVVSAGIDVPFIHGEFTCDADLFRFETIDTLKYDIPKTRANLEKGIAEYITKKANHPDVAEAFWSAFGPILETQPKAIFLNDINLVPRKLSKGRWVAAEYHLARIFDADKSKDRLPGELQEFEGEGRFFATPQGIRISEDSVAQLELFGAIAGTAKEQQLMMNIMQSGLAEIFQEHFNVLKSKLRECESDLAASKLTPDKALTRCEQAMEKFAADFQREGMLSVHEKWMAYARADYVKRRYSIKAGIGIAVGSFGVIGGIVTAVGTGATGVGAAVGVAVTIRKSLTLAADIYTFFREIETVRKVLEKQLTVKAVQYLTNGERENWNDVGRSFLGVFKLNKPLAALEDLAGGEGKLKSVKALRKDLIEYQAKIAKTNDSDEKLLQQTQKLIEDAAELEETLVSIKNPAEKKKRQQYIEELRSKVTVQLDQLTNLGRQLNGYLRTVSSFERLMVIIEENQWSSANAQMVNELLMPVLSMTINLRPSQLLDNLVELGKCTVKLGVNGYALYEYCSDPANAPKESTQLSKLLAEVNDITNSLDGLRKKSESKTASP